MSEAKDVVIKVFNYNGDTETPPRSPADFCLKAFDKDGHENQFKVHVYVLGHHSAVFRNTFMNGGDKEASLPERADVIELWLRCLYDQVDEGFGLESRDMVESLWVVAQKYKTETEVARILESSLQPAESEYREHHVWCYKMAVIIRFTSTAKATINRPSPITNK